MTRYCTATPSQPMELPVAFGTPWRGASCIWNHRLEPENAHVEEQARMAQTSAWVRRL